MIEFKDVTKSYPGSDTPALADFSLQMEHGEFIFLVGPSGAGKSTLIKLFFREQLPTEGQILFDGKNIATFEKAALLKHRRQIGMVFQDFRLLKQKTVFENVAFALEVLGKSAKEIQEKVPLALAKVGLADKGSSFPAELSGGEQQRVGVARALVKDPLILIADEPTGNLDRDTSWQLMELFETINQGGTTVIVATHAWDVVDRMQKRVISLEAGHLNRDEKRGSYRDEH
ncbi:MAG: cell division ATP-binding protein FtsE [Firmicutes bacterium]|nr:cell division ATP-binding protein FtsE [Bacillota bacterium]